MAEKLQAHQMSLPPLPVPPLHTSLEKYLLYVRPFLTEEEYYKTEKIVKEFCAPDGLGVKLHKKLQERAKVKENWLEEWWMNSHFLECRMPLAVYSSPGLVFPIKSFTTVESQLRYAAQLVAAALNYKRAIDSYSLPLDKMGSVPLDMSQYYKIFSTCRLPGHPKDNLVFYDMEVEKPRHIVVAHNYHYFSVDVYADDGSPLNESQLFAQLQRVVEQSVNLKSPIGVLTTLHRDTWDKAYKQLCDYDAVNKESVNTIQKAIFLLCLDKAVPDTDCLNRRTHVALQTIHGAGVKGNVGNRWYDKIVQFIVGEDGVVGVTYEHSPADGSHISSMMDHIVQYIEKTKDKKWIPSPAVTEPKKLKFRLSEETLQDIKKAEKDLNHIVSDLQMSCFSYDAYGKEFMRCHKLSPDSYIQMAIQLAYYKTYNQLTATYEAASTRKFLHGRTEVIRSASMEALSFCKLMVDRSPNHQKVAALRSAIDVHKEYVLQAVNGFGIDMLLIGLKNMALECGMDVPEFFLDPAYTTSMHIKLCTSQVPSKVDGFMCFGAVVADGYACCYNPLLSSINFGLSAYNSYPETDSSKFMNALVESLNEMHDAVNDTGATKL